MSLNRKLAYIDDFDGIEQYYEAKKRMRNLFTYSQELFVSHIGIQKVRNGVNHVPLLVQKDEKEHLYVFAST